MEISRLKLTDLETLATSFAAAFGSQGFSQGSSRKYLSTKYANYLNGSQLPAWGLVNHKGVIACSYSVLNIPYVLGSKDLNVGLVCDVLTMPNFQRQGLFRKIGIEIKERLIAESVDFTIGFPVRADVTSQHLKVGWHHLFDMNLWVGPSIPIALSHKEFEVTSLDDFTPQQRLMLGDEDSIFINPDAFKSRFSRLEAEYKVITIDDTDNFAIVRKAKIGKLTFLAIIHIQISDSKSGRRLIYSLQTYSAKCRLPFVAGCWNNSYARLLNLSKLGLVKTPKVQNFIAREINSKILVDESRYRLSWLDSDAI